MFLDQQRADAVTQLFTSAGPVMLFC